MTSKTAALAKAVADLKLTNADVDGVKADVSLKAELQAAADATIARYGRVHILEPISKLFNEAIGYKCWMILAQRRALGAHSGSFSGGTHS